MGNSTKKLQDVVDYVRTIGDLTPVLSAGGYANLLAFGIANDVMSEIIAQRFNWKFNRVAVPPFVTISYQQDYPQLSSSRFGWMEHSAMVDINNTATPKPIRWLEAVRDMEMSSQMFGWPTKISWLPNDQLQLGSWPGAGKTYTNPIGASSSPQNPNTNFKDANGNILILTTYGVTGNVQPAAAASSASGVTVADGTAVWTVVDPKSQGFRITPLPGATGVAWYIYPFCQAAAVQFTLMTQLLDPIPDDFAKYFIDGFIAYCHRHSTNPAVKAKFPLMQQQWLKALADARAQGDREKEDAGFVPDRNVMHENTATPIGPAWPYGPYGMG